MCRSCVFAWKRSGLIWSLQIGPVPIISSTSSAVKSRSGRLRSKPAACPLTELLPLAPFRRPDPFSRSSTHFNTRKLIPACAAFHFGAGFAVGIVIGLVSSILGVAGGELLIPTMMFIFGVKTAGTVSIVVAVCVVTSGLWRYWRSGAMETRLDARPIVSAMSAGSLIGRCARRTVRWLRAGRGYQGASGSWPRRPKSRCLYVRFWELETLLTHNF